MHLDQLDQQIDAFQWRVAALLQHASELLLPQQPLVAECLKELRTALEELQVAQEEMRQQNEDLAAARQMVEAERQRYQDLFDLAPDGYLVTDADGTIREANRAAATMLNVSQQSLVGKPLVVFVAESDRLAFHSKLNRLGRQNRLQEWELCLQPRHGASFDAALTVTTVRDHEGKVIALRVCMRDITERKQADKQREQLLEQLETERGRLDAVVRQMPAGVVIAEAPSGRIIFYNTQAEQIWQAPLAQPDSMTQYYDYEGFHAKERPYRLEEWPLESVIRMGAVVTDEEIDMVRGDGMCRTMCISSAPIRDRSGRIVAAVLTFYDITERKQLEAKLRQQAEKLAQANRIKDEFLSVISHELRTPLNAMLGWVQLLGTRKFDEGTIARAIETIKRNGKSQLQLIEDILDVSGIIQGQMRLDVRPVNLRLVISAAINTVSLAAQAKTIQISSMLDPTVGLVWGDWNRLQQIVWNLLSNAVKFTPSGGRVEVRLNCTDSQAQITVSDTGKGISAEFLPYVFERFRQADSGLTRSYGGLGLGLAIVRHLVELHGGTVHAESRGEGQGATFTVQLPLLEGSRGTLEQGSRKFCPSASPPSCPSAPLLLNGLRVVVVDDDAEARELITTALEQYGARVTAVVSAAEALAAIARLKPDVLVSDIGMPGEDGYTLIHKVRVLEAEGGGEIPAVALTAHAGEEERQQAVSAGFHMHVPKPVELAELVAVVANLIGRTDNV